ncbi:MAG: hypothetical protein QOJ51_2620, partial [Acidobacteriaceae bacterium]|nr:hypothetical protein [Acidobacteriaceae bacterium]
MPEWTPQLRHAEKQETNRDVTLVVPWTELAHRTEVSWASNPLAQRNCFPSDQAACNPTFPDDPYARGHIGRRYP